MDPAALHRYEIIISAVDNQGYEDQSRLAVAAKAAGVKRFVPCGFTTVAPAGGVMTLRDGKEVAYQDILKLKLGYTFIDVGFWHQISYPSVPSGRLDYSLLFAEPVAAIYGDGNAPNLLTDIRDIGSFVARIIKDPRTLNKKVFTWGDELTQNEIVAIVEKVTGKTVPRKQVSHADLGRAVEEAKAAVSAGNHGTLQAAYYATMGVYKAEYNFSKYVREDNTRANALYLGYVDARELYPEFKPRSFEGTVREVLSGTAVTLYEGRF